METYLYSQSAVLVGDTIFTTQRGIRCVEFGIVRTSLSLYSYFSKYHFKYHRREQYELIHCQSST
jgi:hypothetical protein